MIALVYDLSIVSDPEALGTTLGIGILVSGVPPRYPFLSLPPAGYAVVRETWAGVDFLPGPVTPAEIAALPDPGENPAVAVREAVAALREAVRSDAGVVDPAQVSAALGRLDAIIATGTVPALPASPTNADVVAQVRLLTTAMNVAADAIRDEARILRAVMRLLT